MLTCYKSPPLYKGSITCNIIITLIVLPFSTINRNYVEIEHYPPVNELHHKIIATITYGVQNNLL